MSGTKKHIDKLFADIFRDFSLLVSNKDLEAIDDKTSVYKEQEGTEPTGLFGSFEINVGEEDWLATKAKLEHEKSGMSQDNFMSAGLKDLELPVLPADWTRTYSKLQNAKRRRVAYWWLSAGIVVLALAGWLLTARLDKDGLQEPAQAESIQPGFTDPDQEKEPAQAYTSTAKNSDHTRVSGKTKDASSTQSGQPASGHDAGIEPAGQGKPDRTSGLSKQGKPDKQIHTTITTQTAQPGRIEQLKKELPDHVPNTGLTITAESGATREPFRDMKDADQAKTITGEPAISETEIPTGADPLDTSGLQAAKPADSSKKKQDDQPINPVKLPKTRLYVGLVGQLASTFRHLDRSNNSTYNNIRNAAEKPFAQWTYGVEFGMIRKGMQLSTGIQSTSQSWVSSYNYKVRIYDSLPYRDVSGNIIGYFLVRGRDTSINEQHTIRMNKVQMPIEFTQSFKLNSKIRILGTIGGNIGLVTRTEGSKILNPANNYMYPYASLKDQQRKLTLAPSLALGLQYQLGRDFMLQGSAYGNYGSNRFKSSFAAKDHPYSIGVSLKLMYMIK